MTGDQAKRITLASLLLSASLASAKELAKGDLPPLRIALGAGIAGVLLTGMAELSPDLAGLIALLVLVTAVLVVGGDAWEAIARLFGRDRNRRPDLNPFNN